MQRPPEGDGERVPRARGVSPDRRPELTLLAVVGPTGTGKSRLAMHLARRLDGEIVGCDALQVYRGLDAATAKPSLADRSRIPHHLVDHVDPARDFTMAEYVRQAEAALEAIARRRRVPIVAGGTGLYLRGLLRGVLELSERNPELRGRLSRLIDRFGAPRMHRRLAALDPASAARLDPRDRQRIVRGMELALTGTATWSRRLESAGTWKAQHERYTSLKIGLDTDRERLIERLDARVDGFFDRGLVDEVRRLLADGVPAEANAFKAIGYREVLAALARGDDPELAREEVKRRTRRYAKKQRTWFGKEPGIVWLDAATGIDRLTDDVVELWRQTLRQTAD